MGGLAILVVRKARATATGTSEKANANPRSRTSPLYKLKYPAMEPRGCVSQPELNNLLPPETSCWRGTLGAGAWCVHLDDGDHERISRAWSIAGHAAAAAYVLQGVWRQWLEKYGLSEPDCPVPNLFNRNSQIVGQGVVTT